MSRQKANLPKQAPLAHRRRGPRPPNRTVYGRHSSVVLQQFWWVMPAVVSSARDGRCDRQGEAHRLIAVHTEEMPVALHHVVVDAHDLRGLARFWSQALGWAVLSVREREIVIGPDDHASVGMCFMPVTDLKTLKNRVHLDLTTSAEDRDAEIERLLGLGAQRVDVGQTGAESWTVLADPEGNEFCVVRPKRTLTS